MGDFEQRLQELEETLNQTEGALQREKATMPNGNDDEAGTSLPTCYPYLYIAGAVIPLITAAALYFAKPKWVTKKEKGKQVICIQELLKWTAIITAIGWVGLYLINYCGAFNSVAVCFGGK